MIKDPPDTLVKSPGLDELLQPGIALRVLTRGPIPKEIHHIRTIVDGDYIVSRVWAKYRNNWIYQINHWYFFDLLLRDGMLERV